MFAVKIDDDMMGLKGKINFALAYLFNVLGYGYRILEPDEEAAQNEILFLYTADKSHLKKRMLHKQHGFSLCVLYDDMHYDYTELNSSNFSNYLFHLNLGYELPYLSSEEFDEPILRIMDKEHNLFYSGLFQFDLIGNIFFHLSRAEEEIFENRDIHNRYKWQNSLLRRHYHIPFLNGMVNLVDLFLSEGESYIHSALLKIPLWPANKKYAIALSHNVNKLEKWTIGRFFLGILDIFTSLHRVSYHIRNFWSFIKFLFRNWEPYWNFDLLRNLEKKYGFISTYFFGVLKKNKYDVDYKLEESDLISQKRELLEEGNEIGLLSYYDSVNNDDYRERVKKIESFAGIRIKGVRQNYYRSQPLHSTSYLFQGGLYWDSSRCMSDMRGFINGIGYPYYIFDRDYEKETILEMPVNFSDSSLASGSGFLAESLVSENIKNLIENARKFGSLLVFDFAISNFEEIPYLAKSYENLLKKVSEDPTVWKTSLDEVNNWIERRRSIVMQYEGNRIKIEFGYSFEELTLYIKGYWHIVEVEGRSQPESEQEEFDLFSENTWWQIGTAQIQVIGRMLKLRHITAGTKIQLETERIGG